MKSLTGRFASARGWALLLTLFLGAGLVISACGDEEVPAPTVPDPAPAPTPPDAPGTPAELRISASGVDFIEWSWNAVDGATGYEVQYSADQTFTDEDEKISRTAEQLSYRRENLDPETPGYARVRAFVVEGEFTVESDWSTHISGMTQAPEPVAPDAPEVPTGLRISASGVDFIEWSWNAVDGATGYEVQYSTDEMFTDEDIPMLLPAEQTSYRRENLDPETSRYLRVRAVVVEGEFTVESGWSTHLTGMTLAPEPTAPDAPPTPSGFQVSEEGVDFIEWSWNAVDGVTGYEVQYSANQAFTSTDEVITLTAEELSYRRENLEPETNGYARVRAFVVEGEFKVESDWAIHKTGTTLAPPPVPPPAPTGLRVLTADSGSITWTWNRVEGADGYISQFSTQPVFADSEGSAFHDGTATTTRKVSNLDAESDGYLRVRAFSGSLSDRLEGAWSGTVRGATGAPPPPTALSAPGGLEAGGATATSITLTWDEVDDAVSYEVQQKLDTATNWRDASCGDGGNEVEDTECEVTDLNEGTAYDFRVRAISDSDDETRTASAWTVADSVSTAGRSGDAISSSGMGALNVRWEGTEDTITWIWDRVPGATYDFSATEVAYSGASNPCASSMFSTETGSSATSYELTGLGNEAVALLCLRTTNEQNLQENLSFAWAATTPSPLPFGNARRDADDTGKTTDLYWSGSEKFVLLGGFDYVFRVAADPVRGGAYDYPADVQTACDSGAFVDDGDTDVRVELGEVDFSARLRPYTGYLLCMRYANDAGRTAWAVPANNAELYTAPARPPTITIEEVDPRASSTAFAWSINVRGTTDVPRGDASADFTAYSVLHSERWDHDQNPDTSPRSVTAPREADCSVRDDNSGTWTWAAQTDIAANTRGIRVRAGRFTRPSADDPLHDMRVYLCIQADGGAEGGPGPWRISGSAEVKRATE